MICPVEQVAYAELRGARKCRESRGQERTDGRGGAGGHVGERAAESLISAGAAAGEYTVEVPVGLQKARSREDGPLIADWDVQVDAVLIAGGMDAFGTIEVAEVSARPG